MLDVQHDLTTFVTVVLVDLALAGDNAIVVGLIAAGVSGQHRRQVLVAGIVIATVCRIAFALVAVNLLAVVGLLLAGGLLLLWVAWRMWREFHHEPPAPVAAGAAAAPAPIRSRTAAIVQIGIADVSMSLDNVLAVAGTARHNPAAMVFGLALSIVLMAVVANRLARIALRYPKLNYPAIAIVTIVALTMVWEGGQQVLEAV
jgi:YjbE family integral membrane protein